MSSKSETLSRKDRRNMGKALRRDVPISSHADWSPAADRPDPISLLIPEDGELVEID
ncbi:unnamed protein product [marine sediment metagenome]|uniref:Uncharacterized protein n=1 Tax=marine sediment metagenome TaxID=412755 RepID=X0UQ91_9ZZZZ